MNSRSLCAAHVLGLDESHLVQLPDSPHRLLPATAQAFCQMQQAARADGLDLALASSYRSFARQQLIWDEKFQGLRPVLDEQSKPLDIRTWGDLARIKAILRWSALPGTSRHHWGSDMDVYSPSLLPAGASLRLEPWEYEAGGYFAELSHWLTHNMARFGFYRPFADDQGGVAIEPWHLSHGTDSIRMAALLTPETLSQALRHSTLAGKACILEQLPLLWQQFIAPTLPSGTAL